MSMIALRIPMELKKEMDKVKINWSEFLRQSIQEALDSSQKRQWILSVRSAVGGRSKVTKGTAAALIRQMRNA